MSPLTDILGFLLGSRTNSHFALHFTDTCPGLKSQGVTHFPQNSTLMDKRGAETAALQGVSHHFMFAFNIFTR